MSDAKPLTDDEFNWDSVERCIQRHAPALVQWFYEQRAALASKEAECERLKAHLNNSAMAHQDAERELEIEASRADAAEAECERLREDLLEIRRLASSENVESAESALTSIHRFAGASLALKSRPSGSAK